MRCDCCPGCMAALRRWKPRSGICPTTRKSARRWTIFAAIGSQVQGSVPICVSIWPSCVAIIITAASCSPPMPGWANAVAQGGRYDEVGKTFGRARPATGFSMDLRAVLGAQPTPPLPKAILAPYVQDPVLQDKITLLRVQGKWWWWICLGTK